MKKMITFLTAASLLMGSMTVPVYAATFADIDTVTWSGFKPFLEEAAELKLMSGYNENGKKLCKPRNNVTYCETVQLMFSIMKVYTKQDVSDATVTKWKPIMNGYNIPDWAYKATAYALENEILSTQDLNKLQGNANKINTKAATREDVGIIFGKALDMIDGYDIRTGASLSYADKGSVSAGAVPYLELLNRAGLMVGDTDNKFNPKANISRAEMAVLSVKSYKKLTEENANVSVGTVTSAGTVMTRMVMQNGDLFISLRTASGDGLSLFGSKGEVDVKYDGEKISFEDIGEGDTVRVTYSGTNLTDIEVTYSKAGLEKTTKETYELAELTSKKVTVVDGSQEKTFTLDDDVTVELSGSKSTIKKLQDAMDNASYDAVLTLDQDAYVLDISAYMNDNNPTEGHVMDVDDDEIVIKAGSKEYTYTLSGDLLIEYDGKEVRFSKFEDDYDDYNYYVSLTLDKNNEVEEILIESMEDEYNGTLTFINSNRITFAAGRKEYEYDLADDVDVEIDGKSATVSKLREGYLDNKSYTVKVDLNRDDEVREIIAESGSAGSNSGELKEIDRDEIKIVSGSKEYTYDLASDVDVEINGKSKDLDELEEYLGEYTFTVKLEFDRDEEVTKIEATLTEAAEGELKDIVEKDDTITIVAAGLTVELEVAGSIDITLDDEEITLSELNDELDDAYGGALIYVELEYNSSGMVKEITAYWEDVHGELQDIDTDEDEIKVGSKWYYIDRDAEFIYKLAATADKDGYSSLSRYDDDIDGLQDFLDDCDEANDTCMVSLTLNKDGEVTRIKVVAK